MKLFSKQGKRSISSTKPQKTRIVKDVPSSDVTTLNENIAVAVSLEPELKSVEPVPVITQQVEVVVSEAVEPVVVEQPAVAVPQNIVQPVESQSKYIVNYPDVELSEASKRAIETVIHKENILDDNLYITQEIVLDSTFEHLAPPKKSPLKIIGIILLCMIALGAISAGGWYYWMVSHAAFDFTLQPIVILNGESILASDFLLDSEDLSSTSVRFLDPDYYPVEGRHEVPIILSMGLRSVETWGIVYVLKPISGITAEFRDDLSGLVASDFLANASIARGVEFDVRFIEEPLPLAEYDVGEYILHLSLNGAPFSVTLTIEDTTPPTATPISVHNHIIGEPITPDAFLVGVYDPSGVVSIEFVTEPDVFDREGRNQIVEIIVTDTWGNSEVFRSDLTILMNETPPVLEGPTLIESKVGNPVMFLNGVTAFDSFGRELELVVDLLGFDQDIVGEYSIFISTIDLTGNISNIEVIIRIIEVDPDEVYELVDAALENAYREFLRGGGAMSQEALDAAVANMTQVEQARAIIIEIRRLIRYADTRGGPQSIYEAAYSGLRERSGNCFNYYALGELMLTRAGIPNMMIERRRDIGHGTNHRWSLINPDNAGWHHFDSVPTRYLDLNTIMHAMTQSQTKLIENAPVIFENHGGLFYAFDPSLYPDIVP
ncbi:MAG: hypothetical protein LBC73_07795 [Oscillospiraceae bacterium]|jgi:hypothetical protein|nr:hypothetical protein [Oscillospiraceae bacterium]